MQEHNHSEILGKAEAMIHAYRECKLGGERMPEDANPGLPIDSADNYLYFTLPMALNYQRSAYALWECAERTYRDEETRFLFLPRECLKRSFDEV